MTPALILAKAMEKAKRESLQAAMMQKLRALKLDVGMVREHVFHPTRKWRFDFAWPACLLAVEVEGGIYTGGRHTRGCGFEQEAEKLNEACAAGWRVLRVTGGQIKSGDAVAWVERSLLCVERYDSMKTMCILHP